LWWNVAKETVGVHELRHTSTSECTTYPKQPSMTELMAGSTFRVQRMRGRYSTSPLSYAHVFANGILSFPGFDNVEASLHTYERCALI
jgi:hypothetical protein